MAAADAASIGEAMRQVEKLTGGLPLLHLAVRSQSIPLVRPPVMSPSQTLLNRTYCTSHLAIARISLGPCRAEIACPSSFSGSRKLRGPLQANCEGGGRYNSGQNELMSSTRLAPNVLAEGYGVSRLVQACASSCR